MKLNYSAAQMERMAQQIRLDIIESLYLAGSGHPGGSLSIAEIMSVLYFHEMDIDPQNPSREDRDRFVLSKGHAAPAYYAALANRGYFDKAVLKTLRRTNSILQGHPDRKKVPGVDMSTGSLGQGISAACGMAYYGKKRKKDFYVYCILGDGETQEGQVWEAAMSAGHFKLNHLIVFLDNNNLQIDGQVDHVMSVYPLQDKFRAFNWNVLTIDGNNVEEILDAVETSKKNSGKPTMVICKTVKGKGVSFMENQAGWHGATINEEQYRMAVSELRQQLSRMEKGCMQ